MQSSVLLVADTQHKMRLQLKICQFSCNFESLALNTLHYPWCNSTSFNNQITATCYYHLMVKFTFPDFYNETSFQTFLFYIWGNKNLMLHLSSLHRALNFIFKGNNVVLLQMP